MTNSHLKLVGYAAAVFALSAVAATPVFAQAAPGFDIPTGAPPSEKDPVAVALKARYRNLSMPNLGLNDVDAEALLTYLATTDRAAVAAQTSHQASSNPLRAQ